MWAYHELKRAIIEATKRRLVGEGKNEESSYVRATMLGTVQEENITLERLGSCATVTFSGTGLGSGTG